MILSHFFQWNDYCIFSFITTHYRSKKMKRQNRKTWSALIAAVMLGFGLFTVTAPANAALIKTDIVMLVDESGSMSTIHNNLRDSIGTFASILQNGGLDAQFALIGYGFAGDSIRLLSDFVDAAGFASAMAGITPVGADEPAYDATAYALEALPSEQPGLSYRDDAVKNLILFADEASNSDNYFDADSLDGVLKDNSALFNVVLGGEFGELIDLALNNGGNSFDLNELNTPVQSEIDDFVTNFAEVKLQETVDFCAENPDHPACTDSEPVPAPAGIALLSLGLLLLTRKKLG